MSPVRGHVGEAEEIEKLDEIKEKMHPLRDAVREGGRIEMSERLKK